MCVTEREREGEEQKERVKRAQSEGKEREVEGAREGKRETEKQREKGEIEGVRELERGRGEREIARGGWEGRKERKGKERGREGEGRGRERERQRERLYNSCYLHLGQFFIIHYSPSSYLLQLAKAQKYNDCSTIIFFLKYITTHYISSNN